MQLHDLRVEPINKNNTRHTVIVDGKPIESIRRLDISYSPTEIPTAYIELGSTCSINECMDIKLSFEPDSIRECIKFLAMELQFDKELHDAWQASIYSALEDLEKLEEGGAHSCNYDKAGYILERLIE